MPAEQDETVLILDAGAPPPTQRFILARRLAALEMAELIDERVRDERLTSPEAEALARHALSGYAAACLLFPYDAFLGAAIEGRYDIDRLGRRFDANFEQVAHRLVTLRRPGATGVPFAFLRTDPAGNTSKPFSIAGLRVPRLGGACPLWAIYAAFAQPDRTIAQLAEMPQGERFLFIARRVSKGPEGFGAPPTLFSVMLGCDIAHAGALVYGDAFSGAPETQATPVGFSCRACPRSACAQRAQPAIAGPAGAAGKA
jgi:XRE family transcriptional regulator, fatty acid utilization regulator